MGTYVLGNKNKIVTIALQSATILIYVILIPSSILINSSEVKEKVAESHVYLTTVLGCKPATYDDDGRVEDDDEDEQNEEQQEGEEEDENDDAEADGIMEDDDEPTSN